MKKHLKPWYCLALPALLANCLGVFASTKPENQGTPKPLPPELVKAWRDAGFDAGWMKDVPPQSPAWGFWAPWREKFEPGAIPAFEGHFAERLANLPDPGTAFGLDFHCGPSDGDVTLKKVAKFKNLQSLNLGAVRNPNAKTQIDLNGLAEMTNLRALYLFYLPVTDAQLKHVAGLKHLQVLDLSSTRVTDAGIKELAGLKELRWLNLRTAGVTAKGVAALQRDLPKCKIEAHQAPDLTPEACKKALLDIMRSKPGQALGFFEKKLVDEMEKLPVAKKKDEYHWTGAYRFDPKKATYVLFVSIIDDRPPLLPHPKGYLIHLNVYRGSFEIRDGHVIATVPKYEYTLLD